MIATLTDDEIVALALRRDVVWTVPLLTVPADVEALAAAGRRGMRSLAVRGLLDESGVEPADLSALVADAAGAPSWSAAYAAAEDASIAGSSTFVFHLADSSAIVDMGSADGVHVLSRASEAESVSLLAALGKNVFDFGFEGGSPSSRLRMGRSFGDSWVSITKGKLLSDAYTGEWNPDVVAAAVGRT